MYNLRSGKQNTIELPVEIQLAEDKHFIETVLQRSIGSDINTNMSDSDSSASDLNCSALVNDSDNDSSVLTNSKNVAGTSQVTGTDNPSQKTDPNMQTLINARILDQLDKIGQRLDKIENKTCKKSSDKSKIKSSGKKSAKTKKVVTNDIASVKTPDLSTSMTEEALLQLKVDQRLQELSDLAKSGIPNSKFKSQRGGNVDVQVKNRVRWPHEYILSGVNKERVSYDQLTVTQWVAGFGRTMRDESDPDVRKHMLEYLIALMDDANDFSWTSAKASHAVLLCRMEQGEVKDFSDFFAIERIRRANAQKHVQPSANISGSAYGHKKSSKITKSMPCTYFNQNTCMQTKSHETRGVLYKHICAACFANNGKTFPHPEVDCKSKNKSLSKNE